MQVLLISGNPLWRMEAPELGDCRAAVNEYLKDQYDKKEAAAKDARGGSLFASTRFQAVPADSDKPLTKLVQYRLMQNTITAPDGGNKNVAHVRMALEKSMTLNTKSQDMEGTLSAKYTAAKIASWSTPVTRCSTGFSSGVSLS